jgi:uncharacterized surface protein with fasciclin (FAS1) repeats
MKVQRAIVGAIALLALLTLVAGCTLWTGDGGPPVTATPPPVTATPASTGAGGAEETPAPTATTVRTTPTQITAPLLPVPTTTPTTTGTPPGRATPAADETAAIAETMAPTTAAATPVPTGTSTIAELASADPGLTRFVQALRQGGIYEALNGTETYTVFAPDDAAFDAVPPGTLTRLLFDRDALSAVANYHVAYGRWLSSDLALESSVATRAGTPLPVTVLPDGSLQVDGARVTRPDIVATNGVLHVIDRVMIPPGTL